MWNPPLVDERTGRARFAAGRGGRPAGRPGGEGGAHDLLPALAARRGADPALRPPAPGGPRPRRPGRADRALPRGLHAVAAARDRAAAGGRRAAGRGGHRRAGAGHRRRRPGRRDLRDLPRHRGQPAPDVGARRAARHRPGAVRGGRRRARPVLLPPPRRVPGAAGGVGDPRPRVRGDLPGAPRGGRRTSCRSRPATRSSSATGWEPAARRLVSLGHAARARRALPAARRGLPGREDRPALVLAGLGGDRGARGWRGDRLGGDGSRARPRCTPASIYLHMGRSYEVGELDFDGPDARS